MSKLLEYLPDQADITFAIAVISFIISIWTLISNRIKSRESYTIEVIDYGYRIPSALQFLVCISNSSDSPLSVISIELWGTSCELFPKMVFGQPETWNFRHTAEFPVCIPAHGCQYAYLEFTGEQFTPQHLKPGVKIELNIVSTQKSKKKCIVLKQRSHYLHTCL